MGNCGARCGGCAGSVRVTPWLCAAVIWVRHEIWGEGSMPKQKAGD